MAKKADVEALMEQARELLELGEPDKALKIGQRLKKLRYSGAFEIIASALYEKDDIPGAVEVLREGVSIVPGDWLLWMQLGNYLSDCGLYEEAWKSYESAKKSANVDITIVGLNVAVLLQRMEKDSDAIELLKGILGREEDADYCLKALCLLIQSLGETGQYEEAFRHGDMALNRISGDDIFNAADTSRLYSTLAEALWKSGRDISLSLSYVRQALALNRNNEAACAVLRKIHNRKSPEAQYMRLMIWGKIEYDPDIKGPCELFTNYDVVADDIEEAFALVKDFEPNDFRESFRIEESRKLEPAPDELKGVYAITGFSFYPAESASKT